LGGGSQRGCSFSSWAGSAVAHCTGERRSYLEPNSGSMHVPIEGRSRHQQNSSTYSINKGL
jgi:hypothetical protein